MWMCASKSKVTHRAVFSSTSYFCIFKIYCILYILSRHTLWNCCIYFRFIFDVTIVYTSLHHWRSETSYPPFFTHSLWCNNCEHCRLCWQHVMLSSFYGINIYKSIIADFLIISSILLAWLLPHRMILFTSFLLRRRRIMELPRTVKLASVRQCMHDHGYYTTMHSTAIYNFWRQDDRSLQHIHSLGLLAMMVGSAAAHHQSLAHGGMGGWGWKEVKKTTTG